MHGSAERNFGTIFAQDFKRYRDELILSSKAGYDMWPGPYGQGGGSRKYLISSLDQSLKRMGVEYVDIFYSHRFDDTTPLEETMGALDSIVRSGKALDVGISSYSGQRTREGVKILQSMGTPLLIRIAGKRGQTLAQMALSWVLRDPRVTSALIGASSVQQLEDSLGALDNLEFTNKELSAIDKHAVDSGINIWKRSSDS